MSFTPMHTTRTKVVHEWFVPDGSTAKDVNDAMRAVVSTMTDREAAYDDAFYVRAGDEGIVFYREVEQ